MTRAPFVLFSAALLVGCGTDPNVFHVGCEHVDGFSIGTGLTPSIGWSPDCRIATLAIFEAVPVGPGDVPTLPGTIPGLTTGTRMWRIDSPTAAGNLFEPAVRYGHRPADAIEGAPALPLVAGRLYLVVLQAQRTDGSWPPLQWTGQFRP